MELEPMPMHIRVGCEILAAAAPGRSNLHSQERPPSCSILSSPAATSLANSSPAPGVDSACVFRRLDDPANLVRADAAPSQIGSLRPPPYQIQTDLAGSVCHYRGASGDGLVSRLKEDGSGDGCSQHPELRAPPLLALALERPRLRCLGSLRRRHT